MIINNSNIYYNSLGKTVCSVGEQVEFCFSSKEKMRMEAPALIAKN